MSWLARGGEQTPEGRIGKGFLALKFSPRGRVPPLAQTRIRGDACPMPANQSRGTPGLLLLLFAVAVLLTAAAGWELRRTHRSTAHAIPLTAPGDTPKK